MVPGGGGIVAGSGRGSASTALCGICPSVLGGARLGTARAAGRPARRRRRADAGVGRRQRLGRRRCRPHALLQRAQPLIEIADQLVEATLEVALAELQLLDPSGQPAQLLLELPEPHLELRALRRDRSPAPAGPAAAPRASAASAASSRASAGSSARAGGRQAAASKASAAAAAVQRRASGRSRAALASAGGGDDRHGAAVLRPGGLVVAGIGRPLLAIGDRQHAIWRDAERDQIVLDRIGPAVAQRQVVLARAALVGVTLDRSRSRPDTA